MSIEKALADLTAAVTANTAALSKMMSGAAAGKAADTTTGGKPATTGGTKPKTPKVPTADDIRNLFGGYMSGTKEKGERETRKQNVAAIVAHFGVERATELAEENRVEAIGYLKQFEAGETPDFMNEGGGEDGEDGDSLL